ncbi:MAG: glutamate--tRNA ligase family protein [Thaumarchaeota archaeon]|nr:glutamate--tRNA ligase family protein [Nitrososphaerota archaeon]MDE0266375.1 glutamate--tRNA ligase family protein [Nitrososphaerota archaeon]
MASESPQSESPPSKQPHTEPGMNAADDGGSDEQLRTHITYLALENAAAHGGRTRDKNILGKILGTRRDLRDSIPRVSRIVADVVSQVNAMPADEQDRRLEAARRQVGAQQAEPDADGPPSQDDAPGAWLPQLEGAQQGAVVTRFPPEPNGYPHIGHAKAAIINWDYAAKYGGRCILRIDDTNPDAERKEYLAGINVGLEWLGLEFKKEDVRYTSDDIEIMYEKGERLITSGMAYVCTCKKDAISRNRRERAECKCCRKDDPDEHYKRWSKMHSAKIKAGDAVMRFRGDMKADNAVMRDPVLFRIISTPHYRQGAKYRVWPSYDMAVAVEDSVHGITHAFRSKEFETRAELIGAILDALGMRRPRQHYFSRLAFEGMPTSKRVIKPLMEDGRITGYDDPRVPTLGGLKRRGIRPEAVRKFIESLGMTKADTVAPFETLESINRSMIDAQSTRLFMAMNPRRLVILDGAGAQKQMEGRAEVPNHPLHGEMGKRMMPASGDVYIPGGDFDRLEEGSIVRLLGLAYVVITGLPGRDAKGGVGSGGGGGVTRHGFGSGTRSIPYGDSGSGYKSREEDVDAYARYVTGIDEPFGAGDILDYFEKMRIEMPPAKKGALQAEAAAEPAKKKKQETAEDAKMQWVSRKDAIRIRLTIPKRPFDGDEFDENSLEETEVYTEPHFENVEEGAEIQFVRFGYCRKDTGRRVIFTHG